MVSAIDERTRTPLLRMSPKVIFCSFMPRRSTGRAEAAIATGWGKQTKEYNFASQIPASVTPRDLIREYIYLYGAVSPKVALASI